MPLLRLSSFLTWHLRSIMLLATVAGTPSVAAASAARIAAVTITETGTRSNDVSSDETAAFCATFILTERDVREFFTRAKPVTEREYVHDLTMSRCQTKGEVRFSDGTKGRWVIDRERRGLLMMSSGDYRYYYCRTCTARCFDRSYDPRDEG